MMKREIRNRVLYRALYFVLGFVFTGDLSSYDQGLRTFEFVLAELL
jgi:hypothetical protein